jgi:hypothetical protein
VARRNPVESGKAQHEADLEQTEPDHLEQSHQLLFLRKKLLGQQNVQTASEKVEQKVGAATESVSGEQFE